MLLVFKSALLCVHEDTQIDSHSVSRESQTSGLKHLVWIWSVCGKRKETNSSRIAPGNFAKT